MFNGTEVALMKEGPGFFLISHCSRVQQKNQSMDYSEYRGWDLVVGILKIRGKGATERFMHFLRRGLLVTVLLTGAQSPSGLQCIERLPSSICAMCNGTSPGILFDM